jgi:hypothetical protein
MVAAATTGVLLDAVALTVIQHPRLAGYRLEDASDASPILANGGSMLRDGWKGYCDYVAGGV